MKSSAAPEFFVFDAARGALRLQGPFAYPTWDSTDRATLMPFARAHAFAAAYGGAVLRSGMRREDSDVSTSAVS